MRMIHQEAIRTIPTEGVGKGLRATGGGEASDMPWSGTSLAPEGVILRRLLLADHANAVSIARELANVRHQSKKKNCKNYRDEDHGSLPVEEWTTDDDSFLFLLGEKRGSSFGPKREFDLGEEQGARFHNGIFV